MSVPHTIQRELKCVFTEAELQEKSKQLARECRSKGEAEEEKKASASDYKSRIDGHVATISRLSAHINNGYEFRTVDCNVYMNKPADGQKQVVRVDTGEIVSTEKMTPSEMQEEIDFKEGEKKK